MPVLLYPGSVFSRVVDWTASAVATALEGDDRMPPVYRRKKPVLLKDDPIPCVVVSPGAEGPRVAWQTFGRGVAYAYPVVVVLFYPSNAIETAIEDRFEATAEMTEQEYADVMRATEVVRDAVFKPTLTGVDTVFDVEVNLTPAFEAVGANTRMYAVSGLTVTYLSLESRAA